MAVIEYLLTTVESYCLCSSEHVSFSLSSLKSALWSLLKTIFLSLRKLSPDCLCRFSWGTRNKERLK